MVILEFVSVYLAIVLVLFLLLVIILESTSTVIR